MPKVSAPPRSGKAQLWVLINDHAYRCKRIAIEGAKGFRLTKIDGLSPKTQYQITRYPLSGRIECSCPDFHRHGSKAGFACKHLKALIALGLLSSRRVRPSERRKEDFRGDLALALAVVRSAEGGGL